MKTLDEMYEYARAVEKKNRELMKEFKDEGSDVIRIYRDRQNIAAAVAEVIKEKKSCRSTKA